MAVTKFTGSEKFNMAGFNSRIDEMNAGLGGAVSVESQTLSAAQQQQARQNIDAASTSDVANVVKYSEQTLTAEQQQQAQKNIGVTWPCNPNLLDNWYFGNPVNQRGSNNYTGSYIYGIDRWRQAGITYNVAAGTVTPDSVGNKGAKMFQQVVCKSNELAMTFSVLCDKGLFSVTSPAGGNVAGIAVLYVEFGRMILWDVAENTDFRYAELRFDSATMQTTKLIAVKLELGSEQTLAHQDADGNWVLNEIPDYGEQLARCQRYFLRLPINDTLFPGNTGDSNGAGVSMFIATPVEMRTDPVISNFTANACTRTGMVSNINFSSISCGKTPGGIGLYATASKAISSSPTYTDCVYQVYSTPLDISADP